LSLRESQSWRNVARPLVATLLLSTLIAAVLTSVGVADAQERPGDPADIVGNQQTASFASPRVGCRVWTWGDRDLQDAKLMLYVPGCAISVYDFTGGSQDFGEPFAPQLVPLATARMPHNA
jgi:hypothetical protein